VRVRKIRPAQRARRRALFASRMLGDARAISTGRIGRRVVRRALGRATGRGFGRLGL